MKCGELLMDRGSTSTGGTAVDDIVVARFPPNIDVAAGQTIEIAIDRERLQLFDPVSGESLRP